MGPNSEVVIGIGKDLDGEAALYAFTPECLRLFVLRAEECEEASVEEILEMIADFLGLDHADSVSRVCAGVEDATGKLSDVMVYVEDELKK